MQCPSCHKEVKVEDKNIGALFTCPQCRSVYFINFDGTPDYGDFQAPSEEEIKALQEQSLPKKKNKKQESAAQVALSEPVASEQSQDLNPPFLQNDMSIAGMDLPSIPDISENNLQDVNESSDFQMTDFSLPPLPEEPASDLSADNLALNDLPEATTDSLQMPQSMDFDFKPVVENEFMTTQPSVDMNQGGQFQSVAQEIESFGNQQTVVSGLTYDLVISNVDSKEVMQLLKEALEDSKFGWHIDDYMKQIKAGRIIFKDLTPVQAYVLARRIQFLDITMEWKQNAVT